MTSTGEHVAPLDANVDAGEHVARAPLVGTSSAGLAVERTACRRWASTWRRSTQA
ncbi:hypothetical protein [Polyangium jinanense]|uniref:Uncharacterized protein n=1 Tax=Polyangium jinanense TaxID=2829994 RepID=A0A9X3XHZ3_9BACT|nr:hypothetical protein [Polyangium jinanense]MDC3988396.1 hypothetical protein [Polyangium jinanense]